MRWTRRCNIDETDALSKYKDRADFGLRRAAFGRVLGELGPWDIDLFAAPHNAVCPRFCSLFDTPEAVCGDAFGRSWAGECGFALPEFGQSFINRVLDKIERDNAVIVCVVPWWPSKSFWGRLQSGAWRERIAASFTLGPDSLAPHRANRQHCAD